MLTRGIVGVPRVPDGMLTRAALLARLGGAPLTVLRAPGGSGKTVLLAQWAAAQELPGAWVTVESDTGSRAAFWNAVLDVASSAGLEVPSTLEDGADREALRRDLVTAFRRLAAFVLVIDDAHELSDPLVLGDLLALLHACPGVTALVATRTRDELEAPRHALTLDIAVVEPEELALSLDEVALLAGVDATAANLLEASGGNPLLLRAIVAGGGRSQVRASPEATLRDYLGHLLTELGADAARFASVTAVPDDVDVGAAARLSGLPEDRVGLLLARLEAEGLMMRRDAADLPRYRYHPLVRDALRGELRRASLAEYRRASLVASAEAESRRQYLPALRHAVDAEDYARASDVCLHGGFALLRAKGAAAIIQRVPFRHVARLPFLAVVLGLAANARGERLKALELLTLALGASRALRGRQRVAERVGLALVETSVLRITGRADDAVASARRLATLLDEAAPEDLEEISEQEGSYRLQGALSLFRAGQLAEARRAAERVGMSAHALGLGAPHSLGAASLVAVIDAARGDGTAAAATLGAVDASDYPAEQRDGYVGALAHVARGILAFEAGSLDDAERAVDVLREMVNLEHRMLVVVLRSVVELWRGTPEVGLRLLEAREEHDRPRARLSPQDTRLVAAARVLLNAAVGRLGPAHAALRELNRSDPAAHVLHAAILLLEQRPDLAIERLTGVPSDAGPRLHAATDLLMASASLQAGEEDLADAALRRFLATSALHGVVSPAILVPDDQRSALWELAARGGAAPEIVERLRATPAPLHSAPARASLTRREIEVLRRLVETTSFAEVAATLSVSANTVKSQVRTLYRKLGVTSREEALRIAYRQGHLTIKPGVKSEE